MLYTPLLQVVLSSSPQSEGRLTKTNKAPFTECLLKKILSCFSRHTDQLYIIYKCQRKANGQSRMNNLETRKTLDTRHGTQTNKRRRRIKCKINIKIYVIIINTSQSIKSRISYNVENIIFLEMHDYYVRQYIYFLFLILYLLNKMKNKKNTTLSEQF